MVSGFAGSEQGYAAQTLFPFCAEGCEAQWQEEGEFVLSMDVSLGDSFLS